MVSFNDAILPSSSSPSLTLAHPSSSEVYRIHQISSTEWAGPLTTEQYVENEHQLASHLNITHWILTQASSPVDERPIYASCETIKKLCLVKNQGSIVRDAVVQAIAAVFCEPEMRGRGYASRMLKELKILLKSDTVDEKDLPCVGSILYSDIGTKYYAGLGWAPFPSMHIELAASHCISTTKVRPVLSEDIAALCAQDQVILHELLGSSSVLKPGLAIIPNHRTMLWHHMKEDYTCQKMFGRKAEVKGAIAGEPGNRVWVIWTRDFYGPVHRIDSGNKLHILRLVIESSVENIRNRSDDLEAVLQAAQSEAAEWKLNHVELWNPDESTRQLIKHTAIESRCVVRKTEGVPSLMWFGEGIEKPEWFVNERFAWC